jgi:hypothetical protein
MSRIAEIHHPELGPVEAFQPDCSGRMRLFKKNTNVPPPDPQIGEAARLQAKIGQDYLDFMMRQYDESAPRQARMDDISVRASEQQMRIADASEERATDNFRRYKGNFVPIEDRFLQESMDAGGAADQARVTGQAAADSEAQAAMQREITNRNLTSMGVNPNSGKFVATNRSNGLMAAASRAGAMTGAREGARRQGINMRASASNLGRGMMADTTAAGGLALQGGLGSGQAMMMGNNYLTQRATGIGGASQVAQSGYGAQANTLGQQYAAETGAWSGQQQAKASGQAAAIGAIGTIAVVI